MIVWKTHDLSLTAFLKLSNNISSNLLHAEKQTKKKIHLFPSEFCKLVNTKWDVMTFTVLSRWRFRNRKLQMSFCVLKMSFQSTSVPLASKTNLLEKTQIATPRVCSSVDASQVDFCSWSPFSPVPVHLCPPELQLYPGQDNAHALHGFTSLESSMQPSVSMLMGFSAVCSHVLHHQTHMIAAYLSNLGKMLVSWTQAWSFVKRHLPDCIPLQNTGFLLSWIKWFMNRTHGSCLGHTSPPVTVAALWWGSTSLQQSLI